jgi:SM-20-related protein
MLSAQQAASEGSMIELDYTALSTAPIVAEPFSHILVPHFVPPAELTEVTAALPLLDKGGSFPTSAIILGGKARDLFAELESDRFRRIVAGRLRIDLAEAPTMVTLRGLSREKDGRIHCDSTAKRVTVLLYLNPKSESWVRQEGCLRLLRSATDVEDFAVEVPPTDGTLLIFPNGPTTWHGHKPFSGRRYVVQLNYMANGAAARSELRRHRLSAAVKRLLAA